MAERRQKLRGTTAQLDTLNGPQGLLAVDLTRLELRLYDGTSAAGSRIPNLATVTANFLGLATGGTVTGRLAGSTSIASHIAVGGAALDVLPATGQGRISFNHEQGAPVVDRNSGAIAFNMDDDTNPLFEFSLVGANRVATPVPLQRALTLNRTNMTLNPDGGAGAPAIHLKSATGTTNSYLLMGDSGSITDDFVLRHYTGPTDQQEVLFSVKNATLFSMSNPSGADGRVRTRVPADFDLAINVFGVSALNGPVVAASTMTVAGLATLNGGLAVGAGDPTNLGGTLGVVGAANFSSTLAVAGALSVGGGATIEGRATVIGGVTTGGASSSFGGPVTVGGTLTASGNASVAGSLTALAALNVVGAATTQNSILSGVKSVVNREAGDARYVMKDGTQTMAGPLNINTTLNVGGNVGVSADLGVNGNVNINGSAFVQGSTLSGVKSVVNREAGDARYIQKTDSTIPAPVMNAIKVELIDFFLPVGIIISTAENLNPGNRYPGTTWVGEAGGRAIVGVGSNGESTWAAGETRGSETHVLAWNEMPPHTHGPGNIQGNTSDVSANHTHQLGGTGGLSFDGGGVQTGNETGSANTRFWTTAATAGISNGHTHFVQMSGGATGNAGSGWSHNNVQPSVAFYFWRRTA